MSDRITRNIQMVLPGGRTSPESIAHIIETIFSRALDDGERVDSIKASFGSMSETFTIDFLISAAPTHTEQQPMGREIVDDQRR